MSAVAASRLPPGFQFSQSSLQDFVDCRRRFQYRYLQRLDWPALVAEPAADSDQTLLTLEQRLQLGERFHHLAHQHLSGVPLAQVETMLQADRTAGGELLRRWWEAYRSTVPQILGLPDWDDPLPPGLYPELSVSAGLAGFRLLAKFDLVVIRPGAAQIVDWKTGRRPTAVRRMADRLQTRVYRYLLRRTAPVLWPAQNLTPEQIEMIYWFGEDPTRPVRLPYSEAQFRADEAYLSELIQQIQNLGENEFPLTSREEHCRFCVYRSLCERGVRAGAAEEEEWAWEELPSPFESLDQINEISF